MLDEPILSNLEVNRRLQPFLRLRNEAQVRCNILYNSSGVRGGVLIQLVKLHFVDAHPIPQRAAPQGAIGQHGAFDDGRDATFDAERTSTLCSDQHGAEGGRAPARSLAFLSGALDHLHRQLQRRLGETAGQTLR